jgi:SPP1 gp7 family putative phage head morphogenesis protein
MTHDIQDAITRRAIFVQRFADGNANVIEDKLRDVRDRLLTRMVKEPDFVSGDRLSLMVSDIERILSVGFENAENDLFDMLIEFSEDEAEFNKLMMDMGTPAVFAPLTNSQLVQTLSVQAMSVPVGPGAITIREAAKQFGSAKSREIMRLIQDGLSEGKTISQISKSISDLMATRQSRQAKTLVRTATNATSNLVRNAFFASNTGLIEKYEWISTLDGRTTLICAGRDGNKYKIGKGPLPPAHWGCRSTVSPILRKDLQPDDTDDERPAVGASGPTTVSSNLTYDQWLRKQPSEFQDEVLGETRGALFRRGDMEVRQFRDETGRTYTLDQLRDLRPLAFKQANVD